MQFREENPIIIFIDFYIFFVYNEKKDVRRDNMTA